MLKIVSYVTNDNQPTIDAANGADFYVKTSKITDTTKWSDPVLMGEKSNIPGLMAIDNTNLLAVWSSEVAVPAGSLVSQKLKVVVS